MAWWKWKRQESRASLEIRLAEQEAKVEAMEEDKARWREKARTILEQMRELQENTIRLTSTCILAQELIADYDAELQRVRSNLDARRKEIFPDSGGNHDAISEEAEPSQGEAGGDREEDQSDDRGGE